MKFEHAPIVVVLTAAAMGVGGAGVGLAVNYHFTHPGQTVEVKPSASATQAAAKKVAPQVGNLGLADVPKDTSVWEALDKTTLRYCGKTAEASANVAVSGRAAAAGLLALDGSGLKFPKGQGCKTPNAVVQESAVRRHK